MPGIPAVMVPTGIATLVVPSPAVAEIVSNPSDVKPLPAVESWVLGYFRWRNNPVTLVSFERLAADREMAQFNRVCVFYPLPVREPFDYFALGLSGEPRSLEIPDSARAVSIPPEVSNRFVAGAVAVDDRTLVIPDFDALKAAFYPDR
jgi:chemotaxis signal transduction protein